MTNQLHLLVVYIFVATPVCCVHVLFTRSRTQWKWTSRPNNAIWPSKETMKVASLQLHRSQHNNTHAWTTSTPVAYNMMKTQFASTKLLADSFSNWYFPQPWVRPPLIPRPRLCCCLHDSCKSTHPFPLTVCPAKSLAPVPLLPGTQPCPLSCLLRHLLPDGLVQEMIFLYVSQFYQTMQQRVY